MQCAEKMCKSYSHFFSKKFQHICVSLYVNFNDSLTNDVVSFEQLGPGLEAQLDAPPNGDQEVAGLTPARSATVFRGD